MLTPLIDDLLSSIRGGRSRVKEVCVGYHWIGVVSKYCGLAMNYGSPHIIPLKDPGRLDEKSGFELAPYAKSWNLMEAGIGIAAINSLINVKGRKKNVFEILRELVKGKRVAVVGDFPNNGSLRNMAKELWILERRPGPRYLPDTAAEYIIPKAEVVAITGSAVINKSLERLLELSRNAYTIVMGPSTPMSRVLFDYGADLLAGVKVLDSKRMMKMISQGAGMVSQLDGFEFRVMEK